MRKLTLDLDMLAVESFTTDAAHPLQGTVQAASPDQPTDFNNCGISNPCTTDGQNTIDANLCTGGCGTEETLKATTCGNTNLICCGVTHIRTYACCPSTSVC